MNDTVSLVLTALFSIFILGLIFGWNSLQCSQRAGIMNKRYTYGIVSGCMIETETGFVPLQSYRVIN